MIIIITKVSKSAGWIAQKIFQRWSTSKTIAEITQQGFRGFLARIALRFHTRPGPYFSPLPLRSSSLRVKTGVLRTIVT